MKPVFKSFVEDDEIVAPKSGWTPIQQQTIIEDFNKDKKYSFKTLKEVLVESGLTQAPEEKISEEKIEEPIVIEESVKEPIVKEQVEVVDKKTLVDKASEYITRRVKIEEAESFQQPVAPTLPNNLGDINKRVRYLEQWLSKVSMAGPGGGDANPHDHIEWMERGVRFTPTPRMAYWNNTEDCLNITQADGSTLQVGLENYIRVYNNTANTFANGTFIEFTGVDTEGDAPTFRAFVNNANTLPLYNIGVLTVDVASNTHGRATVLGLVRDIDTTGNTVGEVWAPGDILWASPTYPGNFTKVKPTAPNVALSVAAVTVADATNGIILVRPTVWPRLQYGDFYSENPFVPTTANVDYQVPFSNTIITSGFVRSGNVITALNSGLYKFDFRAQLTSTNSSDKSAVFWFKKNSVNIPFSAVRVTVDTNGGYAIVSNTQLISLTPTDNVSVHFTVTNTALQIDSPPVINGSASVPACQLTVIEAAL